MEEILIEWNYATDEPRKTDYVFDTLIQIKEQMEEAEAPIIKRPKEELEVQDQKQTPACTVFGATHIHNWLNILEDRRYWKSRNQARADKLWEAYCKYRWFSNGWSSIQKVADWFRFMKYISWYVSIPNSTPLDKMVLQMKQAIDIWWFIFGGSAFGNWSKIRKTWIYEESNPQYYLWHWYWVATDYVLKEDWTVDYFRAINSYWPDRWPFGWYFKIYAEDVNKLYTKIIFIDYDDKDIFDKLQEVEKIKQAVALFREVYPIAEKPVQQYLEKIKLWENFSKLYNTTI